MPHVNADYENKRVLDRFVIRICYKTFRASKNDIHTYQEMNSVPAMNFVLF